eukprot:g2326.t1
MAEPLAIVTRLVMGLIESAAKARVNQGDCKVLGDLAQKTLRVLQDVDGRVMQDPSMKLALDHITEALSGANKAVGECCTTSYFKLLLYIGKYTHLLKQAASRLEHALSEIPLASLGLTVDIRGSLGALRNQLRQIHFREVSVSAHETRVLKDKLEKAFFESGKGVDEVKAMIQEIVANQITTIDELKQEQELLKQYAHNASVNKDKQEEFELNQIIEVISESLKDTSVAPTLTSDLEHCLRCPISREIMNDPVVLKCSGMTYERSSIETWIQKGHRVDPLTNKELRTMELVPNQCVKSMCELFLKQSGSGFELNDAPESMTESKQLIVPGIYEVFGRSVNSSSSLIIRQILILQPEEVVKGYGFPHSEEVGIVNANQKKTETSKLVFLGAGGWDFLNSEDLYFCDAWISYSGKLSLIHRGGHQVFEWKGEAISNEIEGFKKQKFISEVQAPPLVSYYRLRPGIVEMEGVITDGSGVQHKSKLVLSLTRDFSLTGWLWIYSNQQDKGKLGYALNGDWRSTDAISVTFFFAVDNTLLDSHKSPTNCLAAFTLMGNVTFDHNSRTSKLVGSILRSGTVTTLEDDPLPNIALRTSGSVVYDLIREISTIVEYSVQNDLKLLQTPAENDVKPGDYYIWIHFRSEKYGFQRHCLTGYVRSGIKDSIDTREPRGHYGIWHSTQNKNKTWAVVWTISKGVEQDGFVIKVKQRNSNNNYCVGETLALFPQTEYERNRNKDCRYVAMDIM